MTDFVLVDTSVWVKHLREGDHHLAELLEQGNGFTHFLSNLKNEQPVKKSGPVSAVTIPCRAQARQKTQIPA